MTPPPAHFYGLDPALVELIRNAGSPERLRRFAAECARLAVTASGLDDPCVTAALDALTAPGGLDGDRMVTIRAEIGQIVRALDDEQFRISAEHDRATAESDEPEAHPLYAEYVAAFRRARAAQAVWAALGVDPEVAAAEAAYEAIKGVGVSDGSVLARTRAEEE